MTAAARFRAVRRIPAAAAVLLLAAGCGDGGDPSASDGDEDLRIEDVLWEDPALTTSDLDTCDSVAVLSSGDQDLRVALVDEDRVLVPEVAPPDGSDIVITNDWITSGGCVPTEGGPIVVVEA